MGYDDLVGHFGTPSEALPSTFFSRERSQTCAKVLGDGRRALNQLALPRSLMKLDETVIAQPKDLLRSFVICADLGGLDDAQAATAAGMDPSTWSQFKNGTRGIKPLELNTFMDQCGNELPLAYWAYSRGYLLSPGRRSSSAGCGSRTKKTRS
jgi:hypothetical protein